ncbi:xanthine dehydrogenase family protein molybdopterin-binding subunit [Amycolatopsis rhabdoformis]|uniref:Xanthine dehydrogenase family protein molybdopterin-binding subunit n=1 Tax=Amycolatopsis rhabdoformis TaxID=1448059 RepID=A0ABZ1I7Q6_9PSEU|nr:xanthine dehydrogenase family protein molybdopterin-binding subunit [Amycolatopsis rhabdoformis]WSE29867.1 xanthine dehydrogenase family protein molybdopterin-binding subunit [Amycolatopsis rhabdoformis]
MVGQPRSRVDGRLKVTGGATYSAEHQVPGLVHAVLVNSAITRGRISTVDPRKALAQPGVLRVLHDFTGVRLTFDPAEVHFAGQPVAVVVATTLEQAMHAASLVEITYEAQAPLTDFTVTQGVPAKQSPDYHRGDADAALRTAHHAVDLTYTIPREHHNPMELPAMIAVWQGDRLTVYDKTQWVQGTAADLEKAFGLPAGHVRVLSPFVGGAFGNAGVTWPHEVLTAFTARELQRPVKLVLTRKQMYSGVGFRPASRQRLALAADADGRLTGLVHEPHTETSRYEQYEDRVVDVPRFLYQVPNLRSEYRIHAIDTNTPTFMRGPGEVSGAFVLESTMDQLAHDLGLDPIELRRRNEPALDQSTGQPFSTRRLLDCYADGARRFGWNRRAPRPRGRRDGDWLLGMGVAAAAYHNNRRDASASARVNADGTAVVASASSDMGPGTYTSMTQVAADALGLRMDHVTFLLGDSTLPKAPLHSGSRTMASVGSAVLTACASLRDRLVRLAVVDPASPLHGAKPEEVTVAEGRLFVTRQPSRWDTFARILGRRGLSFVDTEQTWSPGDVDDHYSSYAYGAVFAEVAVDESLGLVRVRRMTATYDVGRVVNPKLAQSQAIGGLVAGIGMALLEHSTVDARDGRVVNANLADYLVPVNADVPELDAVFLDGADPLTDPLGVKGLGEVVIVGVPAAIANAVFNATGVRATDLPITLDTFL